MKLGSLTPVRKGTRTGRTGRTGQTRLCLVASVRLIAGAYVARVDRVFSERKDCPENAARSLAYNFLCRFRLPRHNWSIERLTARSWFLTFY